LDFREIVWEGVDWLRVDQDRAQWRAVVMRGNKFGFHKGWGIS